MDMADMEASSHCLPTTAVAPSQPSNVQGKGGDINDVGDPMISW